MNDALIVINKPTGLPVHAGRGGGENLEQYLSALCYNHPSAPILAHRLDRDTSGCLILGRNKDSLRRIGKMFMAGRIKKTYWAIVEGPTFEQAEGTINIPLRRQSPLPHRWHMEAHPDGQPSLTSYKVMGASENFTWLELYPHTGRTHQLRVHCKALGRPIVGDKIYGNAMNAPAPPLLHLHARAISIPQHDQPPIEVTAPSPEHMQELLRRCGL